MSCGTCGTPNGYERVWLHIVNNRVVAERGTQHEINAVLVAAGGKGRVQRVTRKTA